uniref:DEAD/DEAH box helicase n=1 Tax=Mesocestoides corti TaxID=53468 RepID=A0A5K3F654_MESCO
TLIFELALCKFLTNLDLLPLENRSISLYLAPLKSLCSERLAGWQSKLRDLGYNCLELTSDSPYYSTDELSDYSVLIATPEKIDSLFRSQEDMKNF